MSLAAIPPRPGKPLAQVLFSALACLILLVWMTLLSSSPASAAIGSIKPPTPPLFGLHRETISDLKVKAPGGFILIERTWEKGHWTMNRRWARLSITQSVILGSGDTESQLAATLLNRNGTQFKYVGNQLFVDETNPNYTITKTASGYRWKDRQGNWIDYNEEGYLTRYGDANDVTVRLAYDEEHLLSGVFDHQDRQILWYHYDENTLTIRDYTEREVQYRYENDQLIQFVDPRGHQWGYTYENGELKTKTDPLGRVTTLHYNANKTVSSITQPDGSLTRYKHEYDKTRKEYYKQIKSPAGKITETWLDAKGDLIRQVVNGDTRYRLRKENERKWIETDASGNETIIEYDAYRNPLKKTYADHRVESWIYNTQRNKVLQHTDENGIITRYDYDPHGNLLSTTEAYGRPEQRITTYSYDPYGQRLEHAIDGVVVDTQGYDDYGNKTSSTDGEGNTTRYTHDVMGNVLTRTMPGNHTWAYTYDAAGNLLTTTSSLNATTSLEYDKTGNNVRVTDKLGHATQYAYDVNNRLVAIIDPQGQSTRINYDADGQVTSVVDPLGAQSRLEYDHAGRLTTQTDAAGNAIKLEFVANGSHGAGQIAAIHYPTYSERFGYDQRGNRVSTTRLLSDTKSQSESYSFDALGNQLSATDAKGRGQYHGYDALGRLVRSTDPAEGTTHFAYDNRDNLISVTNAKGVVIRRYAYDRNDRLIQETRPDGTFFQYSYNDATGTIERLDAKGQKTRYLHDEAGRLTRIEYYAAGGTEAARTVHLSYDAHDLLTGYDDGITSASYSYDTLGRKTGETVNYGSFSLSYGYSYDAAGRKTTFSGADGVPVSYAYDQAGQLNAISLPGTGSFTMSDYRWGAPQRLILPGGGSREWQYDALMRPARIIGKDPADNPVMDYGYDFDAVNNILAKATEHGTYQYDYDTLDRLIRADNPTLEDERYSYDPVGNRLTDAKSEGSWDYSDSDELQSYGGITLDYDANGSLIQKEANGTVTRYLYNLENRLTEVRDGDDTLIARYDYDPFGRRIWKEVGGARTYFFYAEEGLIAEADSSGQITRQYGWQPDGMWGTDPLYLKSGGQAYFYQNDHLGTPQKLVAVSGAVVWAAKFEAFGAVHVDVAQVENPLRFPGQYFDAETGLHYNYFRDYDPGTGRYIESDPIGLEGGLNTYLYANANPVRYSDPLGLWVKRCARGLGDKDQPAKKPSGNLLRHDYISVSGQILSFQAGDGATAMLWSQGRIDDNEYPDNPKCEMVCGDDQFDQYVLEAAREIGAPSYCVSAYSMTAPWMSGARNCQTWADDVLMLAKEKYLEKEKCPQCFK